MAQDKIIQDITTGEYKYGFTTDVQTDIIGGKAVLVLAGGDVLYNLVLCHL